MLCLRYKQNWRGYSARQHLRIVQLQAKFIRIQSQTKRDVRLTYEDKNEPMQQIRRHVTTVSKTRDIIDQLRHDKSADPVGE